jgi:putative transposase
MMRINRFYLEFPFAGSRMLRGLLRQEGFTIGRKRVGKLMKRMTVEALYRKPRTTKPAPGHKIYPYLLRHLQVARANQVWAMDITYLPMAKDFIYLAAVVDWHTRSVLFWLLSVTMDTNLCIATVEDVIEKYGKHDIMNTDQGSQFTSEAFTVLTKDNDIKISMDVKGAWRDNMSVERLWRSVKYEEVYLHAYDSVTEARQGLDRYFRFYNNRRLHSILAERTPDNVYFESLPQLLAA